MTQIAPVSILGLLIFLLSISALLLVMWRKRRRRHNEFELLLDDIKDRQAPRANKLTRRIMEKCKIDRANAQVLSEQLISAEKLFLQHFIEQQLQHKSVENIYEQLCELLDSYLSAIPNQDYSQEKPLDKIAANQVNEVLSADPNNPKPHETVPEPDWGDVFD